jgi:long-chain acyl-CoA synthetase
MEERSVRGVPLRVWKNAPPSLRSLLDLSRGFGDRIYLVYEDERTSYEEHYRKVAGLARVMVDEWGIAKGDRVAIAMRNFPEWPIAFWAATAVGAIVVPLNAWWTGDELEYGLSNSGSRALFCDAERAERLAPHLPRLALDRVVVVRDEGRHEGTPASSGLLRFEDVIAQARDDGVLPDVVLEPDDDATIFYTSGTTGRPKGALGTQRNICGNLLSLAFSAMRSALRSASPPPATDAAEPLQLAQLVSVPFFHATGCHSVLCGNTAQGGKLVMMYRWEAERALELIERERITSFGGVPSMVWQVLESPSFRSRDTSSVKSVSYGGAPAAPELVRRIKQAFPSVTAGNGYGLTETSSVTTFNSGEDYLRKPDSVGPPVPVCDIRIVDAEGKPLPPGTLGEIWIRGPNVVKSYWNNPEATLESFGEGETLGWLRSGDIGRVDEEGFLYVVDRAKDMLIRGGENVYCVEVESVLYEHPAVMDAAVVGLPHEVLGEEVAAVVQLAPGAKVDEADLRAHVAARLAAFKVPVRIELRCEPLPRNANGKILKRQLRDELVAG